MRIETQNVVFENDMEVIDSENTGRIQRNDPPGIVGRNADERQIRAAEDSQGLKKVWGRRSVYVPIPRLSNSLFCGGVDDLIGSGGAEIAAFLIIDVNRDGLR